MFAVVSAAGNTTVHSWERREFGDAFIYLFHFGLLIISVDIKRCACTFTNYGFCRLMQFLRDTVQSVTNLKRFRCPDEEAHSYVITIDPARLPEM